MRDRAAADHTARLLVWFAREPSRFRFEMRRAGAQPVDGDVVLRLALGRSVDLGDPALRGLHPAVLREAACAYVRDVLFRPQASPYETLGLAPDATPQAVKARFRLLMQLVHPDRQGARAAWPPSFAAQANRAYATLRDDRARGALDRGEAERAARARARQARANAAAATPAARWPRTVAVGRRPPPRPVLPEWLTAGVGGLARRHPAAVAFAALAGVAALVVGTAWWDRGAAPLMRDARAPAALPVATPRAALDAPPAAPVDSVAAPAAVTRPPVDAPAEPLRVLEPEPTRAGTMSPAMPADGGRAIGNPAPRDDSGNAVAAGPPGAAVTGTPSASDGPAATGADARVNDAAARATRALGQDEIEAVLIAFADTFNQGRPDAFAGLFDRDARTNQVRGRDAIQREYEALYRDSVLRRMRLARVSWTPDGEAMRAIADADVRIGWRDGREFEQRLSMELELARRDGRVVITRISQVPGLP